MKRRISAVLAALMVAGGAWTIGADAAPDPSFPDVPTSHLFYDDIEWLAAEKITTGYADGTYGPGNPVNRGSMAAFLYRTAGEPEFTAPTTPTFPDVPTSHLFFKEIEWLADEEITQGYADGTYGPGNPVNRGSMAAFLYRLAGEPDVLVETDQFWDVPSTHLFAHEIAWLVTARVTVGYPDEGTYRPGNLVNRGSMAAFLHRYDGLVPTWLQLVSASTSGTPAGGATSALGLSADGRFVLFRSWSGQIVAGDTNGQPDVFLRDLQTGTTTLVSRTSSGASIAGSSWSSGMSRDGRYVLFTTAADGVVPGDVDGLEDAFLFDRETGGVTHVSTSTVAAGFRGTAISADGGTVALNGTHVWTRQTGVIESVYEQWAPAYRTKIVTGFSADGRYAIVRSGEKTLPGMPDRAGVDECACDYLYSYDRQSPAYVWIDTPAVHRWYGESSSEQMTPDGRYVVYSSNMIDIDPTTLKKSMYLWDRTTGTTVRLETGRAESTAPRNISADGRYVSFSTTPEPPYLGTDGFQPDVFVLDRQTGEVVQVSRNQAGGSVGMSTRGGYMSDDGRRVALESWSGVLAPGDTNNSGDVFLWTRPTD